MSLFRRGVRRKRLSIVAFAGTLFAYQALALIGALPAGAAVATCSFSGGTLSLAITGDEVFSQDAAGNILVGGAKTDTIAGCNTSAAANLANTTAVNVTGDAGNNMLTIDMSDGTDLMDWEDINWTVNLGADAAAPDDTLRIDGAGVTVASDDLEVTFGATGIDLNDDGDLDVTQSNVETFNVLGGAGDDTVWGAGSTATGALFTGDLTAVGNAGDDWFASGAGTDTFTGGADEDTIDATGGTSSVTVNLTAGSLTGGGLGFDTLATIEDIQGSGFGDFLTGDGNDNWIYPGAGDDKIDGEALEDTIDYWDAEAAVTVDMDAETATGGSGNDTFSDIEDASGSDFDDTFVDDITTDSFYYGAAGDDTFDQGADPSTGDSDSIDGEGGSDWVDYSQRTEDLTVTLSSFVGVAGPPATGCGGGAVTAPPCADGDFDTAGETDDVQGVENVSLGTGDDSFTGNAFGNSVQPGGGQNVLAGLGGSDTLDYLLYEAGVEVNMAGGSSAGDSATDFENVVGSDFADTITGNDGSNTIKSRKGNDNVRAGGGDDTIKAGGGADSVRAGSGDDDLWGQKGNDYLNGGKGSDFCKGGPGKDTLKSC